MSWTGFNAAAEAAAGEALPGVEALGMLFPAGVGSGTFRFFNSAGVGAPRFRTGRSGSSSASGAEDGAADAPESVARVGRFSTGRFGSSSAGAAAGGVDA